jgi:5S rRNA maturation endonuclease (ribonuclease M5)
VVVEGRKDERALRAIGLTGTILRLNKGISVFRTCENISREYGKVILLTDWDRRGGQLSRKLREGLEANGVQYDENIRAKMATLTKKDIKDVESLHKHLERLEDLTKRQNRKI